MGNPAILRIAWAAALSAALAAPAWADGKHGGGGGTTGGGGGGGYQGGQRGGGNWSPEQRKQWESLDDRGKIELARKELDNPKSQWFGQLKDTEKQDLKSMFDAVLKSGDESLFDAARTLASIMRQGTAEGLDDIMHAAHGHDISTGLRGISSEKVINAVTSLSKARALDGTSWGKTIADAVAGGGGRGEHGAPTRDGSRTAGDTLSRIGGNTGRPEFSAEAGRQYQAAGDPERAIPEFARAIQNGSREPATFNGLGQALYDTGDIRGAYDAGMKAMELSQTPADRAQAESILRLTRGRAEASRGPGPSEDTARAPQAGNSRAFPDPYDPGRLSARAGSGLRPAAVGAQDFKGSAATLARMAQNAYQSKDWRNAYRHAASAIRADPKNADAHFLSIEALIRLRELEKAKAAAAEAVREVPESALLWTAKAKVHNLLGEYNDGLAASGQATALDGRFAPAYLQQAWALDGLGGRRGEVEAALRKAAELDPRAYGSLFDNWRNSEDGALAQQLAELLGGAAPRREAPAARGGGWLAGPGRKVMMLGLATLVGGFMIALGMLQNKEGDAWFSKVRRMAANLGRQSPRLQELPQAGASPPLVPRNGSPGVLAGVYRVQREIGSGGMGIVYEGLDTALERKVAVKKMREEIRADPRERERFLKEARLVAALHHPNIVEIFSIVEEGADAFLIFEFVDGRTVHDILYERKALPFSEAVGVLRGAASALDYAHARGIIHRDLKPSNIMVSRERQVKVMDFGVARIAKDSLSRLSMTNTVVGTPPYMAPEQEQGIVRKSSDVYALAVVLYELVTGRLPFSGVGAGMLLAKLNKTYVPAGRLVDLPKGFDEAVDKAFEPDPDRRWDSAGALVRALEALAVAR